MNTSPSPDTLDNMTTADPTPCTCYTCDRDTWTSPWPHLSTCPTCGESLCHGAVRHDRHGLDAIPAKAQPATSEKKSKPAPAPTKPENTDEPTSQFDSLFDSHVH